MLEEEKLETRNGKIKLEGKTYRETVKNMLNFFLKVKKKGKKKKFYRHHETDKIRKKKVKSENKEKI